GGEEAPPRELELQAPDLAPGGAREVGWPGVLGRGEGARRSALLPALGALGAGRRGVAYSKGVATSAERCPPGQMVSCTRRTGVQASGRLSRIHDAAYFRIDTLRDPK